MLSYVIKRTLTAVMLAVAVASIVFLALYLVPGDPAEVLLSSGGVEPPAEAVRALRVDLGLDRPIFWQYLVFLADLMRGDLGQSFSNGNPVWDTIMVRLPRTLELIFCATIISLIVGIPCGLIAAIRQGEATDRVLSLLASVAMSLPIFVVGTAMVYVFAQKFHLVPAGGYVAFSEDPGKHLLLLLMPSIAIAIGFSATVFRMSRATVAMVLTKDWVRTARSKGISERQVMTWHIVRNALGPVVTVVGLQMGNLLGGSVLVEYVFNWPGLSGYLVTAIEHRDYPSVRGIVLVVATLFIFINLVVDMIYMILDPRVRH
ncbi:ABC transporter permease [Labrenzia sp. OB1]|uniref:ABC transporter permease n=1 Tax=Labrenzia sp. OB1 TaxID=1561204 RepID=UPI0007B2945F|nr:ABC transporter permease [Labrenzia sp. OB1]KZM49563.1 glutathione ABC transporter permease [Labrenzia sp. OB1]